MDTIYFSNHTAFTKELFSQWYRGYFRKKYALYLFSVWLTGIAFCGAGLWLLRWDRGGAGILFLTLGLLVIGLGLSRHQESMDSHFKQSQFLWNGEAEYAFGEECFTAHITAASQPGRQRISDQEIGYYWVVDVMDTQHAMGIVVRHNQFFILDKRTLLGGTPDEFKSFMQAHCKFARK